MQRVRHHYMQPYTDNNYGAVLYILDRLFRTYSDLELSELKYSLDRHYLNEHSK